MQPEPISGLCRRELWVDARDLQRGEEGSEDRLSLSDYIAILATRGREKLAEAPLVKSFTATVRTAGATYKYGEDFFLGDTVTVTDQGLGVSAKAVVVAVRREVGRDGERMELTLGFSNPTIFDIIKRKEER